MTTLQDLAKLHHDDPFWQWIDSPHFTQLTDALLHGTFLPAGVSAQVTSEAMRAQLGKQEGFAQLANFPRTVGGLRMALEPPDPNLGSPQDHGVDA